MLNSEAPNPSIDYAAEFRNSQLSQATPLEPDRAYSLAFLPNSKTVLKNRPDLVRQLRSLDAKNKNNLFLLRYVTSPLSVEKFEEFAENIAQLDTKELLYRQKRKSFISKKGTTVLRTPRKTTDILLDALKDNEKAPDLTHEYPTNSPDEMINALLALKLITHKQTRTEMGTVDGLKKFAEKNQLTLDSEALIRGFIQLANKDIFYGLFLGGHIQPDQIDDFFSQVSRWSAQLALEKTFEAGFVKPTLPYPIFEKPVSGEKTAPTIWYLPNLVSSYLQYIEGIPKHIKPSQEFPIRDMRYFPESVFQFVRSIVVEYMFDYVRDPAIRSRFPNISAFSSVDGINSEDYFQTYLDPIKDVIRAYKQDTSVSHNPKERMVKDVEMMTNWAITGCNELIRLFEQLEENSASWNKKDVSHSNKKRKEQDAQDSIEKANFEEAGENGKRRMQAICNYFGMQ